MPKDNQITLCPACVPLSPCCPTLILDNLNLKIEDDYGNTAYMQYSNITKLVKDVNKVLSVHGSSVDN